MIRRSRTGLVGVTGVCSFPQADSSVRTGLPCFWAKQKAEAFASAWGPVLDESAVSAWDRSEAHPGPAR
jgi:hypothetical protein